MLDAPTILILLQLNIIRYWCSLSWRFSYQSRSKRYHLHILYASIAGGCLKIRAILWC